MITGTRLAQGRQLSGELRRQDWIGPVGRGELLNRWPGNLFSIPGTAQAEAFACARVAHGEIIHAMTRDRESCLLQNTNNIRSAGNHAFPRLTLDKAR